MGERVDVTVTFLRQTARPFLPPQPRPPGKLALLRVGDPPLHFYRYMYELVGRPWNWVSRRGLSDDALCALIKNPAVHLYVLYVDGAPAGMAHLGASPGRAPLPRRAARPGG